MADRVRLRLTGRMTERLIERARAQGAAFGHIERQDARCLRLETSTEGARLVCALAEQYGLSAEILSRSGWRSALAKIRARWTLAVSAVLAAVCVYLLTARVWLIDVRPLGARLPPDEEARILETVNELGAYVSAKSGDIDAVFISNALLSRFDVLSYAGVKKRGVTLTVEYRLAHEAPDVYDASDARSLYALRDAVVLSVEPLAGQACVKPGDTVRAGQTLIRGEERVSIEQTRRIRAAGAVIGRVWLTNAKSAPLAETVVRRTGRVESRSALRLFSWTLDLKRAADFPSQEEETQLLPVGGLYLPLMIERHICYETESRRVEVDRAALEKTLAEAALAGARRLLPEGARERSFWTNVTAADGEMRAEAVVEAEMNIAADAQALRRGLGNAFSDDTEERRVSCREYK